MLTPAQIRAHRFISAVRGTYKADDVDSYFEEVVTSYEQAFKENSDLIKKIGLLAERVEAYRNDEENIKSTLLTAQRTADNLIRESNEKSEEMLKSAEEKLEVAESQAKAQAQMILDEANQTIHDKLFDAEEKANKLIADASKEAQRIMDDSKKDAAAELKRITEEIKAETLCLQILKKESASFKFDLLEKYRQHLEFINAIPGVVASTIKPESVVSFKTEDNTQTTPSDDTDDENAEESVEDSTYNANSEGSTEQGFNTDEQLYDSGSETAPADQDVVQEKQNENDDDDDDDDDDDESAETFSPESAPDTKSKDIDVAIEEIEGFLTDSESNSSVFNEGVTQQTDSLDGSQVTVLTDENELNNDIPAANLSGLRQRAFAQQQESDETEISNRPLESPDETVQLSAQEDTQQIDSDTYTETVDDAHDETENETEDEGFKVYLENLDSDVDSVTDEPDELDENKGLFETVEYDDDDDDDSEDKGNSSHPRFKGFFKK